MATVGNLVVGVIAKTAQFERSMERVLRRTDRVARRLKSVGDDLSIGLSLPLAAAATAAGKMSVAFDDSLTQIISLVGVSRDQVQDWRNDLLALSGAVGRGPKELADALFFVTSAGARGSKAIDILRASAQAAASGMGETKVVADAVTSAINAYGSANLDAADATGILVAAVREGKAEASSLAPVLGRVLPIASEMGVGFDQVAAALAAMTRLGTSAEESATSLRATLVQILKPAKAAESTLTKFGTSSANLRSQLKEKGLLSVLADLRERFEGNEEALTKVFPNVRALSGVLNLVGKNAKIAEEIFASLATASREDLAKAFEETSKSAGFKLRKSMAELEAIMIIFGDQVLPVVIPLVAEFTAQLGALAQGFLALDDNTRMTIIGLVGFAIAIGPALSAVGRLLRGVTLLLSPFALAAGLLGVAAAVIINRWQKLEESMRTIFFNVVSLVKDTFIGKTLEALKGFISRVADTADALDRQLGGKIRESLGRLSGAASALSSDLSDEFGKIKTDVLALVSNVTANFPLMGDNMKDLAAKSQETAANIESAMARINDAMKKTSNSMSKIPSAIARIRNEAKALASGAVPAIDKVKASVANLQKEGASSLGALTAAFVQGKLTAEQFAASVVQSLTKVIIQIAIMRALGGGLFGAFAGGAASGALEGRQAGGPVTAGNPFIVGEQGPEIFVPSAAGNIRPTLVGAGAGAGGGAITIVNEVQVVAQPGDNPEDIGNRIVAVLNNLLSSPDGSVRRMARQMADVGDGESRRAA